MFFLGLSISEVIGNFKGDMAAICERRNHSPPSHEYEAIFERVNRGLFEIYEHCLQQGIPWCKIRPGLWEASEEEKQNHMVLDKGSAKGHEQGHGVKAQACATYESEKSDIQKRDASKTASSFFCGH